MMSFVSLLLIIMILFCVVVSTLVSINH